MFVHETTLEVRYYETDLMGIVHHSNYIRYFECGRNDALVSLGIPIRDIEEAGVMMPVVKVECNYKYPAKQGEKLRIVSEIRELPRAKVTIFNSIYNEKGELVCNGFVTLGFIHKDTRRPTRAPQFFVDKFAEFFQS
ncbi:MAG: thioesterase family protein [Bacteroidales bacterium]|nr:thioesterase family protein [Bacteroidales bacterium]